MQNKLVTLMMKRGLGGCSSINLIGHFQVQNVFLKYTHLSCVTDFNLCSEHQAFIIVDFHMMLSLGE